MNYNKCSLKILIWLMFSAGTLVLSVMSYSNITTHKKQQLNSMVREQEYEIGDRDPNIIMRCKSNSCLLGINNSGETDFSNLVSVSDTYSSFSVSGQFKKISYNISNSSAEVSVRTSNQPRSYFEYTTLGDTLHLSYGRQSRILQLALFSYEHQECKRRIDPCNGPEPSEQKNFNSK